jgi:hypothetical protein
MAAIGAAHEEVDVIMVGNNVRKLVASLVVVGALGLPAVSSAQNYDRRANRSVTVECQPGQRAVLGQRRLSGRTQVAARCDGAQARNVARRSAQEWDYEPERTKTKTALMIGGAAATGAGVGGAISGTKGALIGAAIGGGAASIYEAAKRR